jgi:hypothetical protein
MPKASLRVLRLTLVPTKTSIEVSSTPVDGHDVLEREQLARITELSAMTSSTRRKLDIIHGAEPEIKSKFWAYDDDDDLESNSEEEDISTPTLR